MDHGGSQRPSGKLESLPKDELLKLIKKQALASKDLKKRVADLEEALNKEKEEVNQLEVEKKEWISRGVSAEFEKKDKLVKKDRELELAARLAAEMLEENDGLRGQLQEQKKEHEDILMNKDDIISKLRQEKENLNAILKTLQEEFESTVLESQELKDKIHSTEEERDKLKNAWDENDSLKERLKELEHQLANPVKLNKLKEEFDGLGKENKALREAKMLAEQDRKVKSEQILNFDKDITNLRKELAEKNKIIKEKKVAMDAMKVHNDELQESLKTSETRIQELEAEVLKAQVEKEKYLKAIKSMKTKFERSSLIEDELRKQLNTIVGERDELLKKNLKRNQKLKAKESTDSAKKGEMFEELKTQISSLEAENSELKEVIESHNKKTEEILTKYENLKRDFDNLNFELDELTAIKNEQIEEKERLTAGYESLSAELQEVKTDLNNIQMDRDALSVEKEKLHNENQSLAEEVKNLHLDIESLSDEMKDILAEKEAHSEEKEIIFNEKEAELMKLQEECEHNNEENTKIKEEIHRIKEEFDKSVKENADLTKQLEEYFAELDMFRKGAPETKATILKLESRVEELLNQLQILNEEKQNQESALEELFKSHDDLSNKYDFECKEREKKEKEVAHLEEQLNYLEAKEGKEKATVDLEQQISMLEETINDISASKEHYQQELLVKEQCILQLRNDIEEVRKKYNNSVNQEIENYKYETENMRNQMLSVSKELDISNEEKESLHTLMIEAISERDQCNESLSILGDKLDEVNSNFNIKALECNELRQQLIDHSTPNNSQMDINSHHDEIINLQKDIDYLDQQYKQVSSENFLLKEEFQNLVATKTEYQNDLEEVKIKLDQYEKEKMMLSEKILQFNELTEKYGYDNVYDLDIFISSLTSDVDTSTKMLQNLTIEKEQVDAKYLEIDTKLKNYYIDIEEKNENIYKLENVIVNLKHENQMVVEQNISLANQKGSEIYETDDDVNQKDNEIKQMLEEITEKENEIYEKDNELNRMVIQIHEKDNELNQRNSEIDNLLSQINQKDNEIEQLCNDIRQHKDNINYSDDRGSSFLEKENEQLKEDIASHKEELTNIKQALNDAHLEMISLKTSEENHSNEILEKHILIGELKAELIGLRESCKTEQEKYNQSTYSYGELETKLNEKENQLVKVSQDLKAAETVTENLKSEIDQNNESWNELMEKYEEVQETNRRLQDSNTQLEENFSEKCSAIIDERDKTVEELNQITVINVNVENKLEAALEKVLKLQATLDEKCEAMNGMDALLKEKGDKGSKFKNVAIKAKKELEALRTKYQEETTSLEQQGISLREEVAFLEKELVRQKTECSKHEEEFEEFQTEVKDLQTQLLIEQESLKALEDVMRIKDEQLIKLNASLKVSENSLKNKRDETQLLKPAMEDIQKRLDNALQESTQMHTMKLEIADFERTVDNLQLKLDTKEKQSNESQETFEKMTEIQKNMENELALFKKENTDMENKSEKLKAMLVKLKKDITEKERQQDENMAHINGLDMLIQQHKQTIEDLKSEIAKLSTEKTTLNNEMKSGVEHHEKLHQTLEVKFARVSSDLLTSQKENQSLAQEFEQYKIRAHNVLKQQKSKQNEEEEGDNQQIIQLEEAIQQLKQRLHESNESYTELESTYQEIQTEHEGLQARHHEFIEEIGEKELAWKQKLTQVKLEASTKVLEYQDKLQLLQNENETLLVRSKEQQEQQQQQADVTQQITNKEKENYEEEICRLTEELFKLKKVRLEIPPNNLDLQKQESFDSRNDSVEFKSVSERQEGEGMDSRELEIIDTLSQRGSIPHTPTSPSHASILERLLSPVEVPVLSSPQSPSALKEELTLAKTSLQTALKKNDHMTALIRESEANACRLADQAKVLKEEIRRLERNEEREQALSNMEYLKNVIIKFLKVGPVEKEQLIPVLSTMLKLSDDEKKFVFEYAKGETEDAEEGGSWSSYVYRWTSLS